MRIVITLDFVVNQTVATPSNQLTASTPFMERFTTRHRELVALLKRLERDGKLEKAGRYTLTVNEFDMLSYGLAYFRN
jgi:hypothetical protein